MSVFNSINNAFVALIVIVIVVGLAMGLLVNQTDLVNFISNSAEAEAQHVANQYQAAQNEIDLAQYKVERQIQSEEAVRAIRAETDAKIAQTEVALRVQRESNALSLERDAQLTDAATKILLGLGLGLSFALSVGASYVLYYLARLIPGRLQLASGVAAANPPTAPLERWDDPAYRAWQMAQARTRELTDLREKMARRPSIHRSRL
jgi:ABC-type multidrug transport system fused ATPase/permease subunit